MSEQCSGLPFLLGVMRSVSFLLAGGFALHGNKMSEVEFVYERSRPGLLSEGDGGKKPTPLWGDPFLLQLGFPAASKRTFFRSRKSAVVYYEGKHMMIQEKQKKFHSPGGGKSDKSCPEKIGDTLPQSIPSPPPPPSAVLILTLSLLSLG